uniref:Lipase n=1 Tax=Fagus sylvatica TaxID=28930 RepID=A0A2N9EBW7_FAGSY
MAYTSTTLLLAVLLCVSAVAESTKLSRNSYDGICKTMVETKGYVCEEHQVTTKDGYILGMQRIPVGRSNNTANRPPVFLQHGIFMDAATWVFNSPNESLAFILADNGYDVWLGNNRGTKSSRGHTSLSANDTAYWEWTWEQLVTYDLSAIYEYIHNQTGKKLYYVGHSLGTLQALAAFSKQKLVNMTKSAALLTPIAYTGLSPSLIPRTIAFSYLADRMYSFGIREVVPGGPDVGKRLQAACQLLEINCTNLIAVITGPNCCIKPSTIETFLNHGLQSTSTKNFIHLAQMLRHGNIATYDYGDESENEAHYRQSTPPLYDLTRIPKDIPLFLSYGQKDILSDVKDVHLLLDDLKNHQKDKLVVQYRDDYGHFDFVMAVNAKSIVYDPLMAFFRTS